MGEARTPKEGLDCTVHSSELRPIERVAGDSKQDTQLLQKMAKEARDYILSFSWCKGVRRAWFGWGVGEVCAVFLFEIEPGSKKVDKCLWVIVGDLPSAYLVVDKSPTPLAALHTYVELMQDWVETVKKGDSVNDCIPVNAPATLENAELLERRLQFIRKEFLTKASARRKTIRRKTNHL